jgi:hypothetical protein
VNPAERLDDLTHLALENILEVLAVPLHMRATGEQMHWLKAKQRAWADVLRTRLHVDDHILKKQRIDMLPKLLEELKRTKQDLKTITSPAA